MSQWNLRKQCLVCQESHLRLFRQEKNSITSNPILKPYFDQDSLLLACQNCEMAFVESIPNDSLFYSALYADGERDISIDYKYSGKLKIFKETLATLKKYIPEGKLLDIGTGTGVFLSLASTRYNATGIELGKAAREFAQAQGLNVLEASIDQLPFSDQTFDVVTLIDVLEHLSDPFRAIQEIERVLKPGGVLYIKVPNYKAQAAKQNTLQFLRLSKAGIMSDYVHINHFCSPSLAKFVSRLGFSVMEQGYSASEIWDLNWQEAPRSKNYRIIYNTLVQLISGFLTIISIFFKKDFGLNIFIVAKKREAP